MYIDMCVYVYIYSIYIYLMCVNMKYFSSAHLHCDVQTLGCISPGIVITSLSSGLVQCIYKLTSNWGIDVPILQNQVNNISLAKEFICYIFSTWTIFDPVILLTLECHWMQSMNKSNSRHSHILQSTIYVCFFIKFMFIKTKQKIMSGLTHQEGAAFINLVSDTIHSTSFPISHIMVTVLIQMGGPFWWHGVLDWPHLIWIK